MGSGNAGLIAACSGSVTVALFAATEYGLWVSFTGGREWQSFQHGVPIVPISDMQVYHDDLIVATEGRGFWVLDDMTPLRQLTPANVNTISRSS